MQSPNSRQCSSSSATRVKKCRDGRTILGHSKSPGFPAKPLTLEPQEENLTKCPPPQRSQAQSVGAIIPTLFSTKKDKRIVGTSTATMKAYNNNKKRWKKKRLWKRQGSRTISGTSWKASSTWRPQLPRCSLPPEC